tara:strand:+ start:510 stop:1352 length:843 start_codon:yes stop_codon:yes gene_type:complete
MTKLFDLNNIRAEISIKSIDELHRNLSFYQLNNLYKVNIPCKNNLKKDFLLNTIKRARKHFPMIDVVPHFSIFHQFDKNRLNTQDSLINFLQTVKGLGCKEVLLVSGSQKRATFDSVSALNFLKDNPLFYRQDFSLGVAFNPYLPSLLFNEEIKRLEKKLQSGLVSSIWLQFGTDYKLLKDRIKILKSIVDSNMIDNSKISDIKFYGSILMPSRQFLSRFKFRPWKGVYCSNEFLDSLEIANKIVKNLLSTYKQNKIHPLIETNISTDDHLNTLKNTLME